MRTLKRPMFRKGGSANEGIMHGLERRGYDNGGKIEPFNRYTADTFGSPYYDNEVIMENLRRFQELGMGNPYRELSGRAGFDNMWDFIMRPAEHDIFRKIKAASPNVQKKEAAKKALETATQLSPYKKYFASDMGIDYTTPPVDKMPPPKKEPPGTTGTTGTIDDISVSDLNKERMKIFAPHMQKRMINDALAAASEKFGESTGDWKQDAASAISAAAKAMGGTQDIYDKVSMMTLAGEIQKDIEKSKEKKLGNYEFLYEKAMSEDPKDREWANTMIKQEDKKTYEYYLDKTQSTDSASRLWAKNKYPDVVQTFSATEDVDEDFIKKLKDGVYYIGMGKDGDRFFKVKDGELDTEFSRPGVL